MRVTIARFETYPQEVPTGYAVGFNVTANIGRMFYRDTYVAFLENEARSDEEVVAEAWSILRDGIEAEVARLESLSPLLGTDFISASNSASSVIGQDLEDVVEETVTSDENPSVQ